MDRPSAMAKTARRASNTSINDSSSFERPTNEARGNASKGCKRLHAALQYSGEGSAKAFTQTGSGLMVVLRYDLHDRHGNWTLKWAGCHLTTLRGFLEWKHLVARPKHPKREVEAALSHAEAMGWRVGVGGSHAWGRIFCPYNDSECRCGEFCITSVWSTPRCPGNHADALRRVVDKCVRRT